MSTLNIGGQLILNTDIILNGGEVNTGMRYAGRPVYAQIFSQSVTYTATSSVKTIQLKQIPNFNALIYLGGIHGGGISYPLTDPLNIHAYLRNSVSDGTSTISVYYTNSSSEYTATIVVTILYTKI